MADILLHIRVSVWLLLAVATLWLCGLVWFYQQVPQQQDFPDPDVMTDAIVVLTGGMGRIEQGVRLLEQGRSNLLLISGVDAEVKPQEMVQEYGINTAHPALADGNTRIILDYGPRDTVGNARETARWVKEHGVKSLRLVTSSYHIPRSMLEFRHAMPGVIVLPSPVFPEWGALDKVVLVPRGSLRLILLEYHKYIFRKLYYLLPEEWQWIASRSRSDYPAVDIVLGGHLAEGGSTPALATPMADEPVREEDK